MKRVMMILLVLGVLLLGGYQLLARETYPPCGGWCLGNCGALCYCGDAVTTCALCATCGVGP